MIGEVLDKKVPKNKYFLAIMEILAIYSPVDSFIEGIWQRHASRPFSKYDKYTVLKQLHLCRCQDVFDNLYSMALRYSMVRYFPTYRQILLW